MTRQNSKMLIHLGFLSGVNHLREYLKSLEEIGVNHVALNLRFNQADIEATLKRLAEEVLPEFLESDIYFGPGISTTSFE